LERKCQLESDHSKRKRARRKNRFAALQQSHAECVAENARLKKKVIIPQESFSRIEKGQSSAIFSGNTDGSVSMDRQAVYRCHVLHCERTNITLDLMDLCQMDRQHIFVVSSTANQHHVGHDGYVSIDRVRHIANQQPSNG
jgi:hypothetical protein